MIAIINNLKYDTETSELIYQSQKLYCYSENCCCTVTVYRNKKLAYFKMITEFEDKEKKKIINYTIVPMAKKEVQNFLISEEQYQKYEEIFGEIQEAEGEDYQSEQEKYEIELAAKISELIDESNDFENLLINKASENTPKIYRNSEPKSIMASLQLIWHCGISDYLKAKKDIQDGADCTFNKSLCLIKAIVNQNLMLIKLLIDNGANPIDSNYKAIKIAFCSGNTEIIKLLCENNLTEEIIMYGIEKCSKLKDIESVQFLSLKLKRSN